MILFGIKEEESGLSSVRNVIKSFIGIENTVV